MNKQNILKPLKECVEKILELYPEEELESILSSIIFSAPELDCLRMETLIEYMEEHYPDPPESIKKIWADFCEQVAVVDKHNREIDDAASAD